MTRQTIDTSPAPDILIDQVLGDFQLKGWEAPQVVLQADPDELDLQEQEDAIHLSCRGDCDIRLPYGASVQIGAVHGDAQIKLLEELLKIGAVHGSLSLRNIADLQVDLVQGDLSVKSMNGDLSVAQAQGDVEIRQLEGACNLARVQGDLDIQGLDGALNAATDGDVRLRLTALDLEDCHIQAAGDVVCSIPAGSGLKASLSSRAHSIKVRLPGHAESYRQEQVSFEVGAGDAALSIEAGGSILLLGEEASWEGMAPPPPDFNQQIARQVEAQIGSQMAEITRHLDEQMGQLSESLSRVGLSPQESERIIEQAMRASERETARAQEKMHRAQEKLERKLEKAQHKAEQKAQWADRRSWTHRGHPWERGWPVPPPPPSPPAPASTPAATEEERLLILRMLEQKKITLEEADQLLSALEGKTEG